MFIIGTCDLGYFLIFFVKYKRNRLKKNLVITNIEL